MKSKPLKVNGVFSANGVYYDSNQNSNRKHFTYFLQGTLNVSVYSFSIPISYSYSNQGSDLGYQLPFKFNRLSIHPKYKWATAHIGDVSMTFSPYTLNAHQFTGAGLDLTPDGPFKISVMGGQLLKAINDDGNSKTMPAYKRMGYGVNTAYKTDKFNLGVIGFYANDAINSIDSVPANKGVLPQENIVLSFNGGIKLSRNFNFQAEYASTAITKDIRATTNTGGRLAITSPFIKTKTSTSFYTALNTKVNYTFKRMSVGLGYERIDPGYETLGAYFFNNDFENITLNANNSFFKDKVSLSFNIGYQRDDLKGQKSNKTNRNVGAFTINWIVSKRVNVAGSYSNFSTYTNVKLNQFDQINDSDLTDDNIQALNFKQLSQTATCMVGIVVSNNKTFRQNVALNYNVSDVANQQGGVVRVGDASTFHNMNTSYSMDFPDRELNITPAINATYNTIGREDATTWGPTLGVGKRFFDKTLQTRFSCSYSNAVNKNTTVGITNLRAGFTYVLKKNHNFNVTAIQLFKNATALKNLNEFTSTFGYAYAFGVKKPTFPKRVIKPESDSITVGYKKYYFEGTPLQLTPQLRELPDNDNFAFLTQEKKTELQRLENQLIETENKNKNAYKVVATVYLKKLSDYLDFKDKYDLLMYKAYLKLDEEATHADKNIEIEFVNRHAKYNSSKEKNLEEKEELALFDKKYDAHKSLLNALEKWAFTLEGVKNAKYEFKALKDKNMKKAFQMLENGKTDEEVIEFLEIRLADYFHKLIKEE